MDTIERTPFGKRLFDSREAAGLTQETASKRVGMAQSTLAEAEISGKRSGYAPQLAELYGVSAKWLATGKGGSPHQLLPSSDTQSGFEGAQSPLDVQGDSAVILNFKAAPKSAENYTIHQFATGGAMGHGLTLPDQPGVIENWSVSREWLSKNIKAHSGVQNLCIVTGFGPSMQPMFNPGDPLLVDAGVKSVIADGIYFFRVGSEGFVKQLQKIPTAAGLKYVAKSKNPDYDNFEITPDMDFEVLGKVVRVWCGTDF